MDNLKVLRIKLLMYYGMRTKVMKRDWIMHVELRIVLFTSVEDCLIIEQPEFYVMNYQCYVTGVLGLL
jgi:hypothetical protein